MLVADLKYFAENFGWLVAVALVLILNGDKVAARLGSFIPPLADWLEKRRVAREVETSAKLAAEIEQEDATLHHEFDSEAANQSHQMRLSTELMGILKDTLQRFWEADTKRDEQWERVYTALLRMDSTLSLNTMTVERQASAYGELECVRRARQVVARRKANGDS
jgi:hypothetical protein